MSKFCVNCGAQLDDNAGFCGSCGAQQNVSSAPAAQQAPSAPVATAEAAADSSPLGAMGEKMSSMSPEQKKNIGIIAIVVAAVIIVGIVVGVIVNELTKYQVIDCNDLYYVSYDGINGKAEAKVFFATAANISEYAYDDLYEEFKESKYYEEDDYEGFYNSKASKWLTTDSGDMKDAWTKFDGKSDIKKAQEKLLDLVEIEVDEESLKNLSNGDEIKVKFKYSESKLKKKNIKLENTEITITVKDLVEPEVINAFDGISVTFEGNNGFGEADLDDSALSDINDEVFNYSFTEYYSDDLSNGDVVSVTAYPYYSLQNGYFTYNDKYYTYDENALTKEYTVEGLKELNVCDPFANFSLEYSGIAPDLRVSANTDACEEAVRDCISFDFSQTSGISIGDKITVTATVSSWYSDDFADKYGYKLESESVTKEFTVEETAAHYIKDINEASKLDPETLYPDVYKDINESVGSSYLAGSRVFGYGLEEDGEIAKINSITADDGYLVAPEAIATSGNVYYQILKIDTTCEVNGASADRTFYLMVSADSAYVEDGVLCYDDWFLSIYVTRDKNLLVNDYIFSADNLMDGKIITKFGAEGAQKPAAPEPPANPETPAE